MTNQNANKIIAYLEFIYNHRIRDLSRDPRFDKICSYESLLRENPGIYTPGSYGETDMTYHDLVDQKETLSLEKEKELLRLFGDYKIPALDYFNTLKAVAQNPELINTSDFQALDSEERYIRIGSLFGFSNIGDCSHHRKVIYRIDENKREDFREEFNKILDGLDYEFYILDNNSIQAHRDDHDRFIHNANLYLKYIGVKSNLGAFVPWFCDGYSKEEIERPLPRYSELIQGDGRDVYRIECLENLCNQIANIPSCNKLTISPGTGYIVVVKG